MSTVKCVGFAIGAVVLMIAACITNEVGGTVTPVGETYKASYTYCGAWAGVGGTRHCSLYLTGSETRINTEIKGLWWNTESYKVVR